mgnify:CR=1 FL=1
MDDRLKELMQELGIAINESLSDSDRIAAAIDEIKRDGYDVFLVLEATIAFNKREGIDEPEPEERGELHVEMPRPAAERSRWRHAPANTIKWISQDSKFLRALKISTENEQR